MSRKQPTPQSPRGSGTFEDPFRPNAYRGEITKIAEHARKTGQPAYCNFEGSNFCIKHDGTYERSRHMPPLREGIETIFEDILQGVRDAWNANSAFRKGPLSEAEIQWALLQPKNPDDNTWNVTIPDGATANAVMDQLLALGYTPTQVVNTKVYFKKK